MENRRPYWQVAVSLLFSILATAAFIVIGIRLIGFLMPFVLGWIVASIATPLVNWLEKRMKIVKKLGSALIVILVLAAIILVSYFAVSRLVTEVTGADPGFRICMSRQKQGWKKSVRHCRASLCVSRKGFRTDGHHWLKIWTIIWAI